MRYFLIYFFVFFSLMFSKNAFSEDQKLSDYLTEQLGEYFKKYEVERKEKFIAKEKITELEEELEDEKKALEKSNKKLKNISPIEINRSSAIFVLSSLLLLVIIILFLSLIIIRQRKWRREYYDENNSKFIGQLPERIAETIDRSEEAYNNLEKKNRKQYDNFQQNLLQVAKLLEQVSNKNQENASRINEQLSAIRRYGDEKDVLLKKYQKFYI